LSDPIAITEGLMQGCVASPLLFTLYISDIIDIINKSGISGIEIGDLYTLHMLLFADDMVLLANSPRSLQLKINVMRKYFEELGLTINVEKTKVVFRRGGRLQGGLYFNYGTESIEIVNEYLYLVVMFSSSCVFRKAAELAKTEGMRALGSVFCRAKIYAWIVHSKLFESIVRSTVLYSAHVWGWSYTDILEKVQSQFIRRLFHLDCKTPTYALRLETNSCKLELALAGHTINFSIRLLSMDDSRIAKMCFKTLTSYAGQDNSRYNWSLHLKALLEKTGFEHLWKRLPHLTSYLTSN
jgi:hypothetical protein